MTLILHASDIHFGKADETTVARFLQEIDRQKPDLVVLSGDFTQVGSHREFIRAQEFIASISAPVFTVPGNHDVPRFSLKRFFDPMHRYRNYIAPMPDSAYEDDAMLVVGINTARPIVPHWNWANGVVSADQVQYVENQFRYADNDKVRILVCHHPLVNVEGTPIDTIVWGSTDLLHVLEKQQVDLVLTGHVHHASILPSADGVIGPAMIGSASATSSRLRAQSNGYNLIRIAPDKIDVELIHWDGSTHAIFESFTINRARDGEEKTVISTN
jgi:3',5'-cyclic AMP phosphodiesterase CpdA